MNRKSGGKLSTLKVFFYEETLELCGQDSP